MSALCPVANSALLFGVARSGKGSDDYDMIGAGASAKVCGKLGKPAIVKLTT